jgi:predicted ATPase
MIRSLHLYNFKCFADQRLDIGAMTLLSGLNGMGKSTILQSLLSLRQSYQQGLLEDTGLALNGDIVQLGAAKDALFEGAQDERIGIDLNWTDGKDARWLFSYNRESDVLAIASATVTPDIFETSLFSDAFHYLQAERIGPRVSFQVSDYLVRQHRQLGTKGQYTAHFLSVFEREEIPHHALAHPKAESLRLRDQVEAWIGEVSPGTRLHINQYTGLDLVSLEYSFVSGQQVSNNYRSTNVGFGITYTLPILVALLSSPAGALLLLENPEAHLHPKGQAWIGRLLGIAASCGIQVIVETHSDHVLNGIRLAVHAGELSPEAVYLKYFERTEEQGQIRHEVLTPRMDRNGRIDYWPDGFFDEFDKNLAELLIPVEA